MLVILIEMALLEAALKRLTKEEIIQLTLDYHDDFDQDLKSIKKDLFEVNNILHDQIVQVERKSQSNEQYPKRECLEIAGIPETVSNSSLEETALNIFDELGFSISTLDIETYQCVSSSKKVIFSMSRQKNADRNLFLLVIVCAINTNIFGPSVRVWTNKYTHICCVSNSSMKKK